MTVAARFKKIMVLYNAGKISKKQAKAFFEYPELLKIFMKKDRLSPTAIKDGK